MTLKTSYDFFSPDFPLECPFFHIALLLFESIPFEIHLQDAVDLPTPCFSRTALSFSAASPEWE